MRAFIVGSVLGVVALTMKVWCWFSVWALPFGIELVNASALLVALVALGVLVARKRKLARVGAAAFALALAMLALPVAQTIAKRRVDDAQHYCEEVVTCAAHSCADLETTADGSLRLSNRKAPTLLQPGYSTRYPPRITRTLGVASCRFPDPFPGRSFWEGELVGATWTWEHLMD